MEENYAPFQCDNTEALAKCTVCGDGLPEDARAQDITGQPEPKPMEVSAQPMPLLSAPTHREPIIVKYGGDYSPACCSKIVGVIIEVYVRTSKKSSSARCM